MGLPFEIIHRVALVFPFPSSSHGVQNFGSSMLTSYEITTKTPSHKASDS
jgi:hypothetical protein